MIKIMHSPEYFEKKREYYVKLNLRETYEYIEGVNIVYYPYNIIEIHSRAYKII